MVCVHARFMCYNLFCCFQLFHSALMMLIDRGCLVVSHNRDDISLNEQQVAAFDFLKSLLQPFVEGVWVRTKCVCVCVVTVVCGDGAAGSVSSSSEVQWRSTVVVHYYKRGTDVGYKMCPHRYIVCVHVCMHVCVCVCVCVSCAGLVESHDLLSLDVIRNTLSSLTQLGLIHQPER